MIGIEEPELAVHPGVLEVLAEILDEVSYVSQVVLTTHSPDLIDQVPIEHIRAVQMVDGATKVRPVSAVQVKAVHDLLFSAGELHQMEGLRPDLG